MNAYQTRTAPSYGHDSTYSSFQGTGAPIFGYDSSANYITPISLEIRPRSVAKFLQFTGKDGDRKSSGREGAVCEWLDPRGHYDWVLGFLRDRPGS
jgi:hypothetical protein